jgi:alpha-L-fucosidase
MPSVRCRRSVLAVLAVVALAAPPARAADDDPAHDERMSWWREARFGLFIHWGLYAIPAGEWNGDTGHGEWILETARIPVAEYERFAASFDPVRFDADEWVTLAREAGMGYVVITSKHHDGFCLFDSAQTDYDVMSAPFRRDVCAELAEACRRGGLRIGWYHSIMDWHHPDYLPRRSWEARSAEGADFERYVAHLHRQVEELLTKYGEIGVMWFDGEWEPTWTHAHGIALYERCLRLQPSIIVNNRVDKGRGGMAGLTAEGGFRGDFGTPEQEIPSHGLPGVDWETCMTMNEHWGYNRADVRYKSVGALVRTLVDVASKGGNFLLNVGPRADGTFPPEAVERLRGIGRWMTINGEAIHGTAASPFDPLPWGRCTVKRRPGDRRSTIYLHVLDPPADGLLVLPGLDSTPREVRVLGAPGVGGELPSARRVGTDVLVRVPAGFFREAPGLEGACTVVAVECGPLRVHRAPRIEAPVSEFVSAVSVRIEPADDDTAPEIRYTLDGSDPGPSSPRAAGPIVLRDTATVRARLFVDGAPASAAAERLFTRVRPRPADRRDDAGLAPGLACTIYKGEFTVMPDFAALAPAATERAPAAVLPAGYREEYVARRYRGYLRVPVDEAYDLALISDDGARLLIGGALVVDNDGAHVAQERRGTIALAAGLHEITLEWFNRTGEVALEVKIAPAGAELAPVRPEDLKTW